MSTLHTFDRDGFYKDTVERSDSFVPPFHTPIPLPGIPVGYTARFVFRDWVVVPLPTQPVPPAEFHIQITEITGALGNTENFLEVNVNTGASFTITGTITGLSDDFFRMPVTRADTGRVIYLPAILTDGVLTVTGSMPTSGKWVVTEEAINSALPDTIRLRFSGVTIYALG